MDGLHRIVVSGKNRDLSPTAVQDAAECTQPDRDMELYSAMIRARMAAEYLLTTHVHRRNGNVAGADLYHTMAMKKLDEMAGFLGLDLVPREDVVTR